MSSDKEEVAEDASAAIVQRHSTTWKSLFDTYLNDLRRESPRKPLATLNLIAHAKATAVLVQMVNKGHHFTSDPPVPSSPGGSKSCLDEDEESSTKTGEDAIPDFLKSDSLSPASPGGLKSWLEEEDKENETTFDEEPKPQRYRFDPKLGFRPLDPSPSSTSPKVSSGASCGSPTHASTDDFRQDSANSQKSASPPVEVPYTIPDELAACAEGLHGPFENSANLQESATPPVEVSDTVTDEVAAATKTGQSPVEKSASPPATAPKPDSEEQICGIEAAEKPVEEASASSMKTKSKGGRPYKGGSRKLTKREKQVAAANLRAAESGKTIERNEKMEMRFAKYIPGYREALERACQPRDENATGGGDGGQQSKEPRDENATGGGNGPQQSKAHDGASGKDEDGLLGRSEDSQEEDPEMHSKAALLFEAMGRILAD